MQLIKDLRAIRLFEDTSREYERRITKLALKHMSYDDIEEFKHIMADPDTDCSYEAFFCLATIYRRQKNFSMLSKLITDGEKRSDFRDYFSLKHLRIMYETHSEALYDYSELLRMAHESACELPDNAGYQHTFANAFATICENCLQDDLNSIISEWYDSALYCVNRAIELESEYAKFYSTKARIVVLKNHFMEADRLIRRAIDLEDSDRGDYPLLIGNYQYYRVMNAIKKQQWLLQPRMNTAENGKKDVDVTALENYHPMHSYAFISYSHSDRDLVFGIISRLRAHHINFWYDGELPGGFEWAEEIGKKLIDSQVVLLMISNASIWSKNVRNEITLAQNHNKRIIPIYIENVELSPGAELQLQGYNSYYYYEMSEEVFLRRLELSIQEVVLFSGMESSKRADFPSRIKVSTGINDLSTGSSSGSNESETASEEKVENRIVILQQLCESKTGNNDLNEDIIIANDSFIAVFDGATSKTSASFQGKTGGQLAVQFLANYLCRDEFINATNAIDGKTAVCMMQAALKHYAAEYRLEEQGVHATASGVIYSIAKHQIWSVGDCQFMINGKAYTYPKKVDKILSEARALSIHMFIQSGYTEEALKENDKGRGLILNELQMQHFLENRQDEYGYTVFSSQGQLQTIVIENVLPGSEVVLASDGYPVLYRTLEESEYHLQEMLRNDPLCYREYKSTKGLSKDNSFVDDRSYIRFRVNE